jgi:hypothetical protein
VSALANAAVQITVSTTGGDDDIRITRTSASQMVAQVNGGTAQLIDLGTTSQILIDGRGGADTLTFIGSTGTDAVSIGLGTVVSSASSIVYNNVGSVRFDGGGGTDSLTLASQRVALAANATLSALTITGGGTLDVRDHALVVASTGSSGVGSWDGSAYTGLSGLIARGRGDGDWKGTGITSSSTFSNSDYTTVAVATASDALGIAAGTSATWHGQTVSASDTLVLYTYGGDANLDGKINIDDYGQIDANAPFNGIVHGWFNADFNYDGNINIDDYAIIDGNIGIQGPPLDQSVTANRATARVWVIELSAEFWQAPRRVDDDGSGDQLT